MRYVSDISAQLQPARLCGTVEELSTLGCGNVINPVGVISTVN